MRNDHPTAIELEFLKHLWREKRLSARELHDLAEPFTRWSYSSTRKTLDRMQEKDLVSVADAHGILVYRAKVRKLQVIAAMSADFYRRVLGADPQTSIAAFKGSDFLSREEVEELKRMLEDED